MEYIQLLSVLASVVVTVQGACQDVDSSACQLLSKQRADLCNDQYLANTTCPRFCGLCPVECYACGGPTIDPTNCTATTVCQIGEVCSMRELRASDGRHEYTFDCMDKRICDGSGFNIAFGKRDVESRDLSISCCENDLCNMGMSTTAPSTTAPKLCDLDIVFLVDDGSTIGPTHFKNILSFVQNTVAGMDIGPHDIQVSLITFDSRTHTVWDFDHYQTKHQLLQAIQHVDYHGGSVHTEAALNSVSHFLQGSGSDGRRSARDVVVVISDGVSSDTNSPWGHHHVSIEQATLLRQQGVRIVNVEIGHALNVIHNHVDINLPVTGYGSLSSAVPALHKAIGDTACSRR